MSRKMSEESKQAKKAYDTKYIMTHVKQKRINFNDQNPEDVKLLDWLERQKNENQYVKGLIAEDMNRSGE